MKEGLKFMAVIGLNSLDAKGKLLSYFVYKINGVFLSMPIINA